MTPEAKARETIDRKLALAGWVVQDLNQLNLGAARGVVVREHPTDTGPADYVLFLDRAPVGVIEAKPDDTILLFAEDQTARYAASALKWRVQSAPLPYLFQSTGQVTRFTDSRDPAPRSREVFHFFHPEQLAEALSQRDTLRRRLAHGMPALPERNLRECQVSAVTGLEKSLALNKPRALASKQINFATRCGEIDFGSLDEEGVRFVPTPSRHLRSMPKPRRLFAATGCELERQCKSAASSRAHSAT